MANLTGFAEASYNNLTVEEMRKAIENDYFEPDAKEWNITEQECKEALEVAIREKLKD
ncbi:hypothetical protein [Marinomonas transparens]|uniref:Uncharacterized protein n=1 Tax=Marinomonas transparens TaxID=2795388 RepID=A0A934JM81_9GAMM|nr:hypothetical protein [Marinomonas transparens]MBJ7536968.1 hypothetical protein [Marinomonas transparens]